METFLRMGENGLRLKRLDLELQLDLTNGENEEIFGDEDEIRFPIMMGQSIRAFAAYNKFIKTQANTLETLNLFITVKKNDFRQATPSPTFPIFPKLTYLHMDIELDMLDEMDLVEKFPKLSK